MNLTHRNKLITFGVWDLLHMGHIRFLNSCSDISKDIVVGVQSDKSVFNQKGYYPTINQDSRANMLLSIKNISTVFIYSDFEYEKYAKLYDCKHLALSSTNRDKPRFVPIVQYIKIRDGNVYYFDYDNTISSSAIKDSISTNWHSIWDNVGMSDKNDYEITGHELSDTKLLADYVIKKIGITDKSTILDYGCCSGVLLNEISCSKRYGIDISRPMLERGKKFSDITFIQSNNIALVNDIDHIISWGVLHYLPNHSFVKSVIDNMKGISDSILLMEIPDIAKREDRLAHREKIGKHINPEPLYFSKEFFTDMGFDVYDTELKISDNSDFSFTAQYNKP